MTLAGVADDADGKMCSEKFLSHKLLHSQIMNMERVMYMQHKNDVVVCICLPVLTGRAGSQGGHGRLYQSV